MRSTQSLIPALFASFGLSAKLEEHRVIADWASIVGPQIAAHTAPQEVRARTLWVVVDSSTWLHELTLLKPLLLEKIRAQARKHVIGDVRFIVGDVLAREATVAAKESARTVLAPEDEAAVDQAVSALDDVELRDSARRLFRKSAGSPPGRCS